MAVMRIAFRSMSHPDLFCFKEHSFLGMGFSSHICVSWSYLLTWWWTSDPNLAHSELRWRDASLMLVAGNEAMSKGNMEALSLKQKGRGETRKWRYLLIAFYSWSRPLWSSAMFLLFGSRFSASFYSLFIFFLSYFKWDFVTSKQKSLD